MSAAWLQMIGTSKEPCPESYTESHADFSRRPRRICVGDHMDLYAVGGSKRVFALAEVTSQVCDSGYERWPYRLNISYLLNLPISSGVPIEEVNTLERDLLRAIRRGASFFELSSEEYERAAAKLGKVSSCRGIAEPITQLERLPDGGHLS
jgi:hypothetical protein